MDLLNAADLESVQLLAAENTKVAQVAYVANHNLNATSKSFNVGDEVLVLQPTSANKLVTQWQGVGEVVAVISTNSYCVALPNGSRRTLHANDLRPYVSRIAMLGVIFEDLSETDFGHVETYPPTDVSQFEENLEKLDLSHLTKP